MTTAQLKADLLAAIASSIVDASRVLIEECADGSGRWYASIAKYSRDEEYYLIVRTPAPDTAPRWARERHADWEYVRKEAS